MGQFFAPTIIKERKVKRKADIVIWFYSYEYDSGLKLMQHSYKGNKFVNAVRNWLIASGGGRLVWAGDYADGEGKGKPNVYGYAKKLCPTHFTDEDKPEYHYYNNHDKHEFVDLDKCKTYKARRYSFEENKTVLVDETPIEPLPLLTCEGNGRGGGDYWGDDMELVGRWARDFITCDMAPTEGYKELKTDFRERF